jgi:hypothetical protein
VNRGGLRWSVVVAVGPTAKGGERHEVGRSIEG